MTTTNRHIDKWKGIELLDRMAYRGYYLLFNALHNTWYISKDAQHIGSAGTLAEAKLAVDEIAS